MQYDDKLNLCHFLYSMYNIKYFNGECPTNIVFKFKDWKHYLGKADKHGIDLSNELFIEPFNESAPIILSGERVGITNLQTVLIHEMIHVHQDSNGYMNWTKRYQWHNQRFYAKEKEIISIIENERKEIK